jgi:hypothetical protein
VCACGRGRQRIRNSDRAVLRAGSQREYTMRALLVIAGVVSSCSAELVMGGVSGLLPTLALEAGHGDGRQLAAGAGFENCSNATKAEWETCMTAAKSAFPDSTTCERYDKIEAEFKCYVDFIFTCADLRIVYNDLRKVTIISPDDLCSSLKRDFFANAPKACPPNTYPNTAAVVDKGCQSATSSPTSPTSPTTPRPTRLPTPPTTPRPTFSWENTRSPTTPSPTLSSEEAVCMTFVAGCLSPYNVQFSGLSPSNLALPEKLSKLKTDRCYFDGSWREDYFKCLNTGPPSCAATIANECSTVNSVNVEDSEKACKKEYHGGYPEVRSGCGIKSDWENPYFILGVVVGVLVLVVIPAYIRHKSSHVEYKTSNVEYKTSNGAATVAVAVHIPNDATPVTVADLFHEGRK